MFMVWFNIWRLQYLRDGSEKLKKTNIDRQLFLMAVINSNPSVCIKECSLQKKIPTKDKRQKLYDQIKP